MLGPHLPGKLCCVSATSVTLATGLSDSPIIIAPFFMKIQERLERRHIFMLTIVDTAENVYLLSVPPPDSTFIRASVVAL